MLLLLAVPVMAQSTGSSPVVGGEQYAPGVPGGGTVSSVEGSLIQSVKDAVEERNPDGADAYEAALEAAREAGADGATAQIVATRVVEETSDEITVLPATGGWPFHVLAVGSLLLTAGVLVRRIFR